MATWAVHFIIVSFGIGFGYHRTIAHQAVDSYLFPKRLAAFIGVLANVGSPLSWRKRHFEQEHRSQYFEVSEDLFLNFLDRFYYLILMAVGAAFFLVAGVKAFFFLYLAPMALAFLWLNLSSFLNRTGAGYKNFETTNPSHNLFWLWPFLYGENWHNNHFHSPLSKTTKHRWWELDPVWIYCFLFDRGTYMKIRLWIRRMKLRFNSKPKDFIYSIQENFR